MELWRPVVGFELSHIVSNYGRVARINHTINGCTRYTKTRVLHEKILRPSIRKGYLSILLSYNNIQKRFNIHRLVAQAFLAEWDSKLQVNHKDCNKQNNRVDNLEMVTAKENIQHAIKNNTHPKYKKYTNTVAEEIRIMHNKYSYKELSIIYSIPYNSVYWICNYRKS